MQRDNDSSIINNIWVFSEFNDYELMHNINICVINILRSWCTNDEYRVHKVFKISGISREND